jgi:hypothetical protein
MWVAKLCLIYTHLTDKTLNRLGHALDEITAEL